MWTCPYIFMVVAKQVACLFQLTIQFFLILYIRYDVVGVTFFFLIRRCQKWGRYGSFQVIFGEIQVHPGELHCLYKWYFSHCLLMLYFMRTPKLGGYSDYRYLVTCLFEMILRRQTLDSWSWRRSHWYFLAREFIVFTFCCCACCGVLWLLCLSVYAASSKRWLLLSECSFHYSAVGQGWILSCSVWLLPRNNTAMLS